MVRSLNLITQNPSTQGVSALTNLIGVYMTVGAVTALKALQVVGLSVYIPAMACVIGLPKLTSVNWIRYPLRGECLWSVKQTLCAS